MNQEKHRTIKLLVIAVALAALAACGGGDRNDRNISLPGLSSKAGAATTVNRYLWAASLETLDFLPISTVDPISGLIITEWYVNPESPTERFKTNVYILDQALRADALRVSVFRQERDANNEWTDATVNPSTSREIENAILTRARQLRLNQIDG